MSWRCVTLLENQDVSCQNPFLSKSIGGPVASRKRPWDVGGRIEDERKGFLPIRLHCLITFQMHQLMPADQFVRSQKIYSQHCVASHIRFPYLGPQFIFWAVTARAKQDAARMKKRMIALIDYKSYYCLVIMSRTKLIIGKKQKVCKQQANEWTAKR